MTLFKIQKYYDIFNEEYIWRFWVLGFYFSTGKKDY